MGLVIFFALKYCSNYGELGQFVGKRLGTKVYFIGKDENLL